MLSEKKNTTIVSTIFSYTLIYNLIHTHARERELAWRRYVCNCAHRIVVIVRTCLYIYKYITSEPIGVNPLAPVL